MNEKLISQFYIRPLLCPSFLMTHVCICTENYIVVPLNKDGNIAVWNSKELSKSCFILNGHHKLVTALALSHYPTPHYLCSCSSDNIILWNLLDNGGNPKKGRVLHSHMEQPVFCHFDSDNQKIGISFTNAMWIFDLKVNAWLSSIADISFTIFKFGFQSLIGIEDNCIKVWNTSTNEVETKISLSAGFPTSFCVLNRYNILAVGTSCGHVNVYKENDRLLRNFPVWRVVAQSQKCKSYDEATYDDIRSDSFPIYSIHAFHFEKEHESESNLPDTIYLLVVTSTCLFIVNVNNEVVLFYFDYNNEDALELPKIGLIRSAAVAQSFCKSFIFVSLIPVMRESIIVLKLLLNQINPNEENLNTGCQNKDIKAEGATLTFSCANNGDSDKSLLDHTIKRDNKKKNFNKPSANLNQPVTFHSNIKSSGYGTKNKPVTLFRPQINKAKRIPSLQLLNSKKFPTMSESKTFPYDLNKKVNYLNLVFLDKVDLPETSVTSSIQLTVDGTYACRPASEGNVDIFKVMKKTIKVHHTFSCHAGEVNSAKWSHTGKLVVTSSNDKTAKIWDLEKSKQNPILTIGCEGNLKTMHTKRKFLFEDSVIEAQFYYLDHFILAISKNKLYLFDYNIEIGKSGIKSIINNSVLKLVKAVPVESKQITTVAAVNQYFSNLVLSANTSKSIDAIDMTVGKIVWHTENIGSKAPHVIAINEGSPYVTQPSKQYDLFLTSAITDGIKIWDLRTKKSILCYKEHKCRSLPCSAAFSPCGKYIISGSEDKSAYIYDLRQLSYLEILSESTVDVFTSAAFSPNSKLILSAMNGSLFLYGSDE